MFSGIAGMMNRDQKLKGTVVLMQKNVLDINELTAVKPDPIGIIGGVFGAVAGAAGTFIDTATSFLGRNVALKLISATVADGSGKGKVGKQTFLEGLLSSIPTLGDKQSAYDIHFEWNSDMGIPGAFYIENFLQHEFFLTYLPSDIPAPLVYYIEEEFKTLRGDGKGERKEWERVYDYNVYNDLGDPDSKATLARPVLGGSSTLPYPRRDPKSESRSGFVYLPRDESFGHTKSSDFLAYILKSASQNVIPRLRSVVTLQFNQPEFNTFEDVRSLYDGGIKVPTNFLSDIAPIPLLKEILRTDGESALKSVQPKVAQVDHSAWMTDEEFAREMIAGVTPHIIKKLEEFPPKSKLDSKLFGDNTSTITKEQLEPNLGGVTVTVEQPLAIELSKPHPQDDSYGPVSDVYLPASEGVEARIWLLAKAYVVVNDSCYHQLVSHWLNTHAVVEPFIIATKRHLSVVHPIHKLLLPHYRDTM
ncbi:lipoxygenase, partial [Trifolium medium]|nr:lipoxygenase [Trifolium medium]